MISSSPRYLERIEIANFRAYGDSFTLSLPKGPGITLIHGPNGLGKTTLFDAVEWCLTGRISRFDDYLTAAAGRRTGYLTRFGAPEGSHRVSLYFSGANPIDRGLGVAPTVEEVVEVLKQPHWPGVSDLGMYLSITHFLGQSAKQRFSVKRPKEQWDALKGPAGVDRVNYIRDRLGGQAARMAFNRRIRQAEDNLEQARKALANWRELSEQLQRTRSLARVRDAMSPTKVIETCIQVILSFEPLSDPAPKDFAQQGVAPEAVLEHTREVIGRARELVQSELSSATTLETLAEELERIAADQRALEELVTAEVTKQEHYAKALAQIEEQLRTARAEGDAANHKLVSAQTEVRQLLRLIEVSNDYTRDATRVRSVSDEIAETEARIRDLVEAHSDLSRLYRDLTSSAAAREKLRRDVAELRTAAQLARDVEGLKEQVEKPFQGVDVENTVRQLARRSSELGIRQEALRREVGLAENELAEIDRRNGLLVALVGQIAGILREEDSACPVCATTFAPGELLSRIRAIPAPPPGSAQSTGERLSAAHTELAAVEQGIEASENERRRLDGYRRDRNDIADREGAILLRVQAVVPDAKVASLADVLQLADRYEQELAAAQLMAHGERSIESCRDDIRALETERDDTDKRLSVLRSGLGKIAASMEQARIVLAQRPEVWSESDGLVAGVKEDQARAAVAMAAAQAHVESTQAILQGLEPQETVARARVAESIGSINTLQKKRSAIARRVEQLLGRWKDVSPVLDPSLNSAWQLRINAEERNRRVAEAEQELDRTLEGYTAWIDDAERQRLEASLSSLLAETGITSEAGLDAHYSRVIENAQHNVGRLERTRDTALRIANDLQHKADEYAQSVLQPLSDTIQSYSRALLTRADESLFYRAHYSASRSELRPGITRQNADGRAVTIEMNPNLYFSEGQLSALSVSNLLAASTTFRWSQWPALLMDDPLQHNDVIHASAFIDLLRRLVQKLNYQVILSTHDSDEAEFILRKCESADIPIQLCELRPAGHQGLASL